MNEEKVSFLLLQHGGDCATHFRRGGPVTHPLDRHRNLQYDYSRLRYYAAR
jgi:hypothetical protein